MTAIVTSNNQGAFPNIQYFPAQDVIPDALILQVTDRAPLADGDSPQVRIPYVDDVDASFVDEGTAIDQATPTLSEITVNTKKVAVITTVSNEAYRARGVEGLLTNSLRRSVINKADHAFLQNVADPTGLVNTPGIHDGGALGDNLDTLVDAIAQVETNGAAPTHIIAAPDTWAAIRKLKTGDASNQPLVNQQVAAETQRVVEGLPVIVSRHAEPGSLLILDRNEIVSSVSNVELATTQDAYFSEDAVGIRASIRFGWGVIRGNRIAKLALAETE